VTHRTAKHGQRVLIAAPFGRDAESVALLLGREGYATSICRDIPELTEALDDYTGAILLTEEALRGDMTLFQRALESQPAWSDVPFVLLAARKSGSMHRVDSVRNKLPAVATTVIVLERPVGSVSLISAVESAMRARQKQFEIRDRMLELSESRKALEASEAELRLIADSMPVLIAFVDASYRYRFANKAYEDWFGRRAQDVVGQTVWDLVGQPAFEERRVAMEEALAGKESRIELPLPRVDGTSRDCEIRYLPRRSENGEIDGFHVFVLDITERKQSEKVLRRAAEELEERVSERTRELHTEMANREKVEAALRQSHKMEAVGQLTGGIAHDFNNMLTGIIGSIDVIRRRLASGRTDDLDRFMDAASVSANRAASLTQRLLAFSRRQSLDSKATDVNALIASLEDLLSRTIDERSQLAMKLDKTISPALTDANQLESAILNLAINARDAMPDGGSLRIETREVTLDSGHVSASPGVKPGRYILITVSDSGVGMAPELIERVFEPFFTTKPIGQGTGLGLSMVYGFARQSGGQVRIHSEVGKGTSVTIYLPVAIGLEPSQDEALPNTTPMGHGQTVLLVEDDASVRLLVRDVLEELGYAALEAAEPQTGVALLSSKRTIDLMISDVGLPGMNGRQLAEIAREHHPDLPVLFITGYAENAAIRSGFLGTNMAMITKPFSLDVLAAKIGEMLGNDR
jgi:PAS domain S-box-containing protein